LQNVQLHKRRPDPRRSRYAIEKQIIFNLLKEYKKIGIEIVLDSRESCYSCGLDYDFLKLIFEDFERVSVGPFGFHVRYYSY
jgi:hypothetical protein